MNVKIEKIQEWETGVSMPTLRQAKILANYYRIPFVYFYLPDIPKKIKRLDKVDYRTFGNIGNILIMSRELRWLLRDIEERRDTMLSLYEMDEETVIPFALRMSLSENPQNIADAIRQFLGITYEIQANFRKPENLLNFCISVLEQKDFLIFQAAKTDPNEMRGALKGYMEKGVYTVGNYEGVGDAGVILLGNIKQESMDEYDDMFRELPYAFHESALLDRFHGFIRGWDAPRMHDDMKMSGWALNSEYFCSIMHMLRDDVTYRAIVDQVIEVPPHADTRDTEAIKRITTAFLKLLFPNVRSADDINPREFLNYCLRPAMDMRGVIKIQLGIMDIEFKGKDIPDLKLKDEYLGK